MSKKWTVSTHSKSRVKAAGKLLRDPAGHTAEELREAQDVAGEWRGVHSYALNAAQVSLRNRIWREADRRPDVSQRLKELPSIVEKLRRGAPRTQLSTMQDIAGCRGILRTVDEVERLVRRFTRSGSRKSTVVDIDDYISDPAPSGYRGVHLITEYYDRPNDQKRLVEVQLRTKIQHDWAVGVEQLGKRSGHALKQSEGPHDVLEYLRIASKVFEAEEMSGAVDTQLISQLAHARQVARDTLGR